jgi:hypothetical protein
LAENVDHPREVASRPRPPANRAQRIVVNLDEDDIAARAVTMEIVAIASATRNSGIQPR